MAELVMCRDGFVDIRVGSRSAYSNPGYSRSHGVIKPDLVVPGQYFTAAAATNTRAFLRRDSSGLYQLFNGTSAATPDTAGVVALAFQKKPTLTLGELKKLFQNHCTQDRFTTEKKPSPEWGYGKLNYKAVEKILDALE